MAQFIGFLKNTKTRDEFVAPADAEDRAEAQMLLELEYPAPTFTLHTLYSRTELNHALSSIDRWPGLPSKVQPMRQPLEQMLANVTAHQGNLPPLPGKTPVQPKIPQADGATIAAVKEVFADQSPEVRAFAARLMGATMAQNTAQPVAKVIPAEGKAPVTPKTATGKAAVEPAIPQASAIAAIKALHGVKAGAQAVAVAPSPVAAMPKPAPRGMPAKGSLIEVLRAMKH